MEKSPITTASAQGRLHSLDALRGFDMFWIVGGSNLIVALAALQAFAWMQPLAVQMTHVAWEGFRFYDLIFPLFMFISGVAIPFALSSRLARGVAQSTLVLTIIKRGVVLVFFGIVYNGVFMHGFAEARYASVLGQIGIAYVLAALIVLYCRSMRVQGLWLGGILGGMALLQLVVPVPGYGAGTFDPVTSINALIDQLFLPGVLYGGTYDNEGLLNAISASSVTLSGALAGGLLRMQTLSGDRKTLILAGAGVAMVAVALLISPFYPIIKNMWTVSFNLLTAGLSALLLAVFYYAIDVKSWNRGLGSYVVFFFTVIGMNSITIYMAARIFAFDRVSRFFLGWLAQPLGEWVLVVGVITVQWAFLYYLYKRKIFLKV